jgi:membrane protein DedA with SNARE-associated domain
MVWVALGWTLGDQWEKAGEWGDYLQYGVVVVVGLGLVALIVRARSTRGGQE